VGVVTPDWVLRVVSNVRWWVGASACDLAILEV
jgi:hypothetical protein